MRGICGKPQIKCGECPSQAFNDKTIRVDVAQDVLVRTETPSPVCKDEYVERLIRFRRHFAQIAGVKYDDGQFVEEVNVLVVRITSDDLPQPSTANASSAAE